MKVLVADDHDLLREGLIGALRQFDPEITVFEAASVDTVREIVRKEKDFDLILLDLFMPGGNGVDLVAELCNRNIETPLVVISASEDVKLMKLVIDQGAAGYIPKTTVREVLVGALRLVLSGGVYIPPDMIGSQRPESADEPAGTGASMPGAMAHAADRIPGLTGRQKDVLRLVVQGKTNKQIAAVLGLSENTVKTHVAAIMRVLGVSNRTQVVAAIRTGID